MDALSSKPAPRKHVQKPVTKPNPSANLVKQNSVDGSASNGQTPTDLNDLQKPQQTNQINENSSSNSIDTVNNRVMHKILNKNFLSDKKNHLGWQTYIYFSFYIYFLNVFRFSRLLFMEY